MKKTNKIQLNNLLNFVMAICFLVAIAMIFVPVVKVGDESYNGLKVVFGYTAKTNLFGSTSIETEIFKFSFLNLLTYVFVLVALVITCMHLVKGKKGNDMATCLTVLLALVAGVFFLLTRNFTVVSDSLKTTYEHLNTTFAKESELGAGSIVGAVVCFLGCISGAAKIVLSKVK